MKFYNISAYSRRPSWPSTPIPFDLVSNIFAVIILLPHPPPTLTFRDPYCATFSVLYRCTSSCHYPRFDTFRQRAGNENRILFFGIPFKSSRLVVKSRLKSQMKAVKRDYVPVARYSVAKVLFAPVCFGCAEYTILFLNIQISWKLVKLFEKIYPSGVSYNILKGREMVISLYH